MLVVVLKDCVTETKDAARAFEDLDQLGKIGLCPAKALISRNSRPP
jgi:hypothetical protein